LRIAFCSAISTPDDTLTYVDAALDKSQNEKASAQPNISGDAAILARRYANALYELADEAGQLDAVAEELRAVRGLLQDSSEFREMTKNPRLKRSELVVAMEKVASTAKFGKLTGNFLQLLAQNRRLEMMDAMIAAFLADLAARRGEFTAEVQTAQALTPEQHKLLGEQLQELAGGKVNMVLKEEPGLLGGLRIKLGSRLIDASVKGKLARLERALKSQQEAA
jgi:F-type H+-transporting ATPase subunit delta